MKAISATSALFGIAIVLFTASEARAQVRETDSLALVAFYNSTDGPNWLRNEDWLAGPVSTWQGVRVSDGRVVSLVSIQNNMTGQLPPEFYDLTALTSWRIFGGSILRRTS